MSAESLHDYSVAAPRLQMLENNWKVEIGETIRRRLVRLIDVSVEALRATKKIKADATFIPRRIADANIRREQAPYIAYITQSRDLAKFRRTDAQSDLAIEALEREFTTFGQYERWMLPFFQVIDGAMTHGWDAIETLFDESKPGHFCNQHVGHENLQFAFDVCDIQDSPIVSISYNVTPVTLVSYVAEYGFDKDAVEEVIKKLESEQNKMDTRIELKKVYFKDIDDLIDGKPIVYVGWYCRQASKWLMTPERLFMGVQSEQTLTPETEYPVEILLYTVSENEIITQSKGRVFFDEHDQEACTQLVTAFVNRAIRSSHLMFAPKNPTDDGTAIKQTEIVIGDGKLFTAPVEQFNIEPPDPSLLNAMSTIVNQNANEIGQVNFAVTNRKDSRKTATEIQTANQQSAMLNSVQVTLLSSFLRNVFKRNWRILQSQVVQGKVKSSLKGWEGYYSGKYILLAAGDVDVIKRQELLQKRKQDWPVLQTTAAAQPFLEDIIRESYPDQADKYIRAIEQGNQKDQLIQNMGSALMAIVKNPDAMNDPKMVQALSQLAQQFMAVMQPQAQEGINDNAPESGGEQSEAA